MKIMVLNDEVKNETPASDSRVLSRQLGSLALGLMLAIVSAGPAVAGPTGGEVVGGDGSITARGDLTQIDQYTNRISINWDTFDVAANETVRFVQPGSTSVALNTIFDQNPSQIFGTIEANGRVLLINPNGLIFSPTAQVNVAGLVASSLNISTADFMAGNYTFEADGSGGMVLNQGSLQAAPGGFIALLGEAVANEGLMIADAGTIAMGAGTKVALDFDGSGLIYFEVESDVLNNALGVDDAVRNSGSIFADGGQVLLTAAAAQDVYTRAINNEGLIQARRIENRGGVVRLTGNSGNVVSSGSIDATGQGGDGGSIDVTGANVRLASGASVDVSGDMSGGVVHIGGGFNGANPELANSQGTVVEQGAVVAANAGTDGNGGSVAVWSDGTTEFHGHISATGGSEYGDGGFAEVSGAEHIIMTGSANLSAMAGNAGELLIDPGTVTICDDADAGCTQGDPDTFTDAYISNFLDDGVGGGANLTILTSAATDNGPEDINFVDPALSIAWANANALTLTAGGNISLDGTVTAASGTLNLNFGGGGAGSTLDFGSSALGVGTVIATGGAGSDTIVGNATANTFVVTGAANSGTVNGHAFSSVENLTGGAASDSFTFGAAGTLAGTIDGAGGSNSLDVSGAGGGVTVNLATGAATLLNGNAGGGFSNINEFTGDNANDTLIGPNGGATFATSGINDGTVAGVTYTDFANITGGTGADTFNLNHDVTGTVNGGGGGDTINVDEALSGNVAGGAGNDTINLRADVAGTVDGGDDDDTFNLNNGVSIDTLTGGAGGSDRDTLALIDVSPANQTNDWVIDSVDGGTVEGQAFSEMENLTGNGENDVFTFTAALSGTASGGAEDDTFAINDGGSAGTIDGGTQATATGDVVTYVGATGPVTVAIDGFTNVETLTGSGNAGDTLQGTGNADAFTVSGANSGVAGTINFSGFENLDGLAGNDTFTLAAGGSVASISGGADNDTIVGNDGGNVFVVNAANGGTANGTTFANVENLDGGAAGDSFTFVGAGVLDGSVDGAGGASSLDVSAANGAITVSLANNSATPLNGGAAGGFSNIDSFTGDNASDTLIGPNGGATFDTSGTNDGTVAGVTYTDFANITGGTGADTFNLNHDVTGSVNGGDAADSFNLAAGVSIGGSIIGGAGGTDDDELVAIGGVGPNTWTVTSDDTGTLNGQAFSDIENLTGNENVDNFQIDAVVSGTVAGQGDNDVFDFGGSDGSAGFVDGGAGTDAVSFAGRTSGVTVDMANINAVESLTGSALDDTFNINGDEGSSITIAGGGGIDTVAIISSSQITGDLNVSDVDAVSIGADLDVGANNIDLAVDGAITQSGAGGVLTAQSVTTSSVGGQTLDSVTGTFTALNSGSGDISLTNTGDLVIAGISQTGGSVSINTTGALNQTGAVTATAGISLSATGEVTQSDDITITGVGDVSVTTTGGSIVMDEGAVTHSNGGDITYETTGTDADITLATLRTCDDCSAPGSTGDVVVRTSDGDILGYQKPNQDDAHITAASASLIAGGNIGTSEILIKLRKMNPQGDASDSGKPIFLEFSGTANVDSEINIGVAVSEISNLAGLNLSVLAVAGQVTADQAATQEDEKEVDWAAYSEDITLYEINNEGVQLPEQEEVDEFVRIDSDQGATPIAQNRRD